MPWLEMIIIPQFIHLKEQQQEEAELKEDTPTRKYGDSGGAWAKGSIYSNRGDTIADGHSSIAIGGDDLRKAGDKTVTYTLASGTKTGSLRGALGDLAGVPAGDVQRYNVNKIRSGAVALGV